MDNILSTSNFTYKKVNDKATHISDNLNGIIGRIIEEDGVYTCNIFMNLETKQYEEIVEHMQMMQDVYNKMHMPQPPPVAHRKHLAEIDQAVAAHKKQQELPKRTNAEMAESFACDVIASASMLSEYLDAPDFSYRKLALGIASLMDERNTLRDDYAYVSQSHGRVITDDKTALISKDEYDTLMVDRSRLQQDVDVAREALERISTSATRVPVKSTAPSADVITASVPDSFGGPILCTASNGKRIGVAEKSDDGYYYFSPYVTSGYWTQGTMSGLGLLLHDLNKEWHAQVCKDLEK